MNLELVEAECHCLHKKEHMLTIQAYRRAVSVIYLAEPAVANPDN